MFFPGKSMPDAEIIVYAIKGKAFIAGACQLQLVSQVFLLFI